MCKFTIFCLFIKCLFYKLSVYLFTIYKFCATCLKQFWTCSKTSSPPWHCKNRKITNFCFIWKWSLMWRFILPTSVLQCYTLCNIFSENLIYRSTGIQKYHFVTPVSTCLCNVFFRKSIIEIWEINPWRRNSSIIGSREQEFAEFVGYFWSIEAKIRKSVF